MRLRFRAAQTGFHSSWTLLRPLRLNWRNPIVALGREGKQQLQFNPEQNPHTAAMAAKVQTGEGRNAYRKRKWIAEPPNGWIKSVLLRSAR